MDIVNVSQITSGIVGGVMVSGFLLFILKTQDKKIDSAEKNIKILDQKKTDVSVCKTIHHNIERSENENKKVIIDVQEKLTQQSIDIAEVRTCLALIQKSLEDLKKK